MYIGLPCRLVFNYEKYDCTLDIGIATPSVPIVENALMQVFFAILEIGEKNYSSHIIVKEDSKEFHVNDGETAIRFSLVFPDYYEMKQFLLCFGQ